MTVLENYYEGMLRDILETSDDPDSRQRAKQALENGKGIKLRLSRSEQPAAATTLPKNEI